MRNICEIFPNDVHYGNQYLWMKFVGHCSSPSKKAFSSFLFDIIYHEMIYMF